LTERSCCTATGSRRSAWLGTFFFSFLEKRMDEKNKWIRRERERERNWSVCTRAGLVGFSNDKRWLGLGFLVYRELFVRVDYRTFQLLLKYSSALPLRDYCQRLGPDQRIRNYRWVSLKTWWWQSCLSIFNQVNDFISRGNRQPFPTLQHTHAGAPWWLWWWHVLDVIFYSAERKEKNNPGGIDWRVSVGGGKQTT
jgi:hypothetical protein